MKNHVRFRSQLVSALVLMLAPGAVSAQSMPPSGSFGFLINASFTNPLTNSGFGILGVMNFDGAGNVAGTYTVELGADNTQAAGLIPRIPMAVARSVSHRRPVNPRVRPLRL